MFFSRRNARLCDKEFTLYAGMSRTEVKVTLFNIFTFHSAGDDPELDFHKMLTVAAVFNCSGFERKKNTVAEISGGGRGGR